MNHKLDVSNTKPRLTRLYAVYQVVHGASPLPPGLRLLAGELLVTDGVGPAGTVIPLHTFINCFLELAQLHTESLTWKKFLILVTRWSDREDLFSLSCPA